MRAVPTLYTPMRIGAGYGAFSKEDRYEIVRLPYDGYAAIKIMSMPKDPVKAQKVLSWFLEHDEEFEIILDLTPTDEPVDVSTLVMSCIRSIMQS